MMRGLSYPESVLVCFPNSLLSSGVFGVSLLLLPLLLSLLTWLLTLALGLSFCKNKSKLQLRRPGGGPILTPVIIAGGSAGLKCFHFALQSVFHNQICDGYSSHHVQMEILHILLDHVL